MWQDDKAPTANANSESATKASNGDEVIINGVCVMNTDYNRDDAKSPSDEHTNNQSDDETDINEKVGRSPRRDDDDDMDADRPKLNSKSNETIGCDKENDQSESNENDSSKTMVKKEVDDTDRWDY